MNRQDPLSVTELMEALSQFRLLEPDQLQQLKNLQNHFPDPESLADRLRNLGWLSAYQIQEILAGRTSRLVLGSYVLMDCLGGGGMGEVYKARHMLMQRTVAIKIIRPDLLTQPHIIERFHREIRAIAQLDHVNIVRALHADQLGNRHFIVMEYLEGITLSQLVKRQGPLSSTLACEFICQAAQGLQHIHERGLVHRDLKPGNLMYLPRDAQVKILDLGLVLLLAEGPSGISDLTNPGSMVGTVGYVAPEQALNSHAVDIRADVYSLGCILFYLLVGENPFNNRNEWRYMLDHPEQALSPLARLPEGIGVILRSAMGKMMAFEPEHRFQTPREVHAALNPLARGINPSVLPFLAGPPTIGYDPTPETHIPSSEDKKKPGWSRRVLLTLAGMAAAMLLAVAGLIWFTPNNLPQKGQNPPDTQKLPEGKPNKDLPLPISAALPPGEMRVFRGHPDWVADARFLPDGKHVLSVGEDGLHLWEVESGKEIDRFLKKCPGLRSLVLASDGNTLLTGSQQGNGNLWVWDLEKGKFRGFLNGHLRPVERVTISPDGMFALSASDMEIWQWELAKLQPVRSFENPETHFRLAICWPQDKLIISASREIIGGKCVVQEWSPITGKETRQFLIHTQQVVAAALSPDGGLCLAVEQDHSLVLFDVNRGKEIRRLQGHRNSVRALAFSADCKRALSGDGDLRAAKPHDCTLRLWDVDTGKEIICFTHYTRPISAVAFSADGRFAVSASRGEVRYWRLPPPE